MPILAKSMAQPTLQRLPRATHTALVATLISGLLAGVLASSAAHAQGLIRDAETESLIREYARPIFSAAGLGSQNIKIHLVNDKSFNAFVVDGQNMFMHAGTLMISKTPNQVIDCPS